MIPKVGRNEEVSGKAPSQAEPSTSHRAVRLTLAATRLKPVSIIIMSNLPIYFIQTHTSCGDWADIVSGGEI